MPKFSTNTCAIETEQLDEAVQNITGGRTTRTRPGGINRLLSLNSDNHHVWPNERSVLTLPIASDIFGALSTGKDTAHDDESFESIGKAEKVICILDQALALVESRHPCCEE